MKREDFSFASSDGTKIACYRWLAPEPAAGIVQLAHGMGEHALRYARLGEFLNQRGFHLYANDHRGHGRSATDANGLGDFGSAGWIGLVADMVSLTDLARAHHPELPLTLLGHSMGSFAAQQYILDHSALIDSVVLSGSAAVDRLSIDPSQPADLTAFNDGIVPARTPYDWLSRDPAEVDKYVADPLCGFGINVPALQSMAASAPRLSNLADLARIRRDLPIYIFAGDADPINHHLEWLTPLAERYRAAGLTHVAEKYYPDGRHEMLNETNREEVMRDLVDWICMAVGA